MGNAPELMYANKVKSCGKYAAYESGNLKSVKYTRSDIAESRIKELEEENKKLRSAIESALKIKDLWLISDIKCPPEHQREARALQMMEGKFYEALKQIES